MTPLTNSIPQPEAASGALDRVPSFRPVEGRDAAMSAATPAGAKNWLTDQPAGDVTQHGALWAAQWIEDELRRIEG